MKRLPRAYFGNPILRQIARAVSLRSLRTSKFQRLIEQMFFTMRRVGGVGLAAPQVDKPLQLAVIEIKKTAIRPDVVPLTPMVIINPKILNSSKEQQEDWEGCLSLPAVRGLVPRHKRITVEYVDRFGKRQIVKLSGFQARVFQHEIDHLHGVLYVDRMVNMRSLMTLKEFKARRTQKRLTRR
jgi:peptide deformylase